MPVAILIRRSYNAGLYRGTTKHTHIVAISAAWIAAASIVSLSVQKNVQRQWCSGSSGGSDRKRNALGMFSAHAPWRKKRVVRRAPPTPPPATAACVRSIQGARERLTEGGKRAFFFFCALLFCRPVSAEHLCMRKTSPNSMRVDEDPMLNLVLDETYVHTVLWRRIESENKPAVMGERCQTGDSSAEAIHSLD